MTSGVQLPLFFILFAGSGATGVTGAGSLLPDEVNELRPIARREMSGRSEVVLGASGELLEKAEPSDSTEAPTTTTPGNGNNPLGDMDICNMNFVEGKSGKQECLDASRHQFIVDKDVCRWAASVTGLTSEVREAFEVSHVNYTKYPRGCIKKPCSDAPNAPECIFYNYNGDDSGVQDSSQHLTGSPVCFRDRYQDGKALTGGKDAKQCLGDYTEITTERECSDLSNCMDVTAAEIFRIDEQTSETWEYNLFPRGCFINTDDQQLYWNEPQAAAPSKPKGKAICKSQPGLKKV